MATNTIINITAELLAAVISFVTLFCLVISRKQKDKLSNIFYLMLTLSILACVTDAVSWAFENTFYPYSISVMRISTFCLYIFGPLWGFFINYYIYTYVSSRAAVSKTILKIQIIISILIMIGAVVSQFNDMFYYFDEFNVYHRGPLFMVPFGACIFLTLISIFFIVIKNRKILGSGDTWVLSSYFILPVVATTAQIMYYGIMFFYISMFLATQVVYVRIQAEQEKRLKEKELELVHARVGIMPSQIQPHFLYNTLGAIDKLYFENTESGHNALMKFSRYLRGNMDSITRKTRIPFSEELAHVKQYLWLEELRFGEKLCVVYDIQSDEFTLPVLSLQPIVENAVRHGITKKQGCGNVIIKTEETKNSYIIEVKDDGIGFNPDEILQDGRSHIGIGNVRERLHSMCGGKLTIHSEPGCGTTATIEIPKQKAIL